MTQLFLWMVMTYGISNILVYGSIFNGPRNKINQWAADEYAPFNSFWVFLADMLKCMMCTPTWVGFFFSLTLFSPWHEMIGLNQYISIFFDGMLSAGAVWALNGIIEWFEENRPNNNQN